MIKQCVMRERLRTLVIKVPVSLVLLFSSTPLLAHAATLEYHVGFENWISRDTVTPSYFPILDAGIFVEAPEYKVDAEFRVSPTHPKAYAITGSNIYYGQSAESPSPIRFSVGRRLVGWSKFDELWALGTFEPLDSWDRLRATPQGLTGIFATYENDAVIIQLFGSYLFLPETTPNIVIENNKFVLDHPQAISTAPQTYTLLNRPTPLGYELSIPDLQKILLRPSIAAQIETNFDTPFKAKFSYGYLPLNYFPIALQASLAIPLDQIVVQLHPRLLHHHLYNGELSLRLSNQVSIGGVALFEVPESDVIPTDYTTTPLTPSQTYSPWIQFELPSTRFQLSHLWSFGGLDADVGPYADPNSSIFSSRILYRDATQMKVRYLFNPVRRDSAYFEGKYVHEWAINADWLAADLVFFTQKNLSFLVGGDLISAEKTVADARGAEFLADVRAIDRVRLGVQYVF